MGVPAQTGKSNKVVTTNSTVGKAVYTAPAAVPATIPKVKVASTPTTVVATKATKVANPAPAAKVGVGVYKGANSDNGTTVTGKAVRNYDIYS